MNQKKLLTNVKNILVATQYNQIGDMIATLPMYAALKEKFPGSHITFAAAPTNYPIPFFDLNPYLDEVLIYDKSSLSTLLKFYKNIWKRKYQLAIAQSTIKMSRTAHVICFLSGAKIKLGVEAIDDEINKAGYLLNVKKKFSWNNEKKHQSIRGLELIQQLFKNEIIGDRSENAVSIPYSHEDEKFVKNFLSGFKESDNFLLGIHPGAGKKENIWDHEKFVEVIKKIDQKQKVNVVITCGTIDEEIIIKIKKDLESCSIPYLTAKNFSINQLSSLINTFNLYITNDTGPMHIAGSTSVKQISLFGPTNAWEWGPIGINKVNVQSQSHNINDISWDQIYNLI
ncbi:glycosyltransferase family 9 protein [soil metagenome]